MADTLALFTAQAQAEVAARRARYEEEVREQAEQGYAPHYCIHGANLWVDYDIPCGFCEGDDRTDEQYAQDIASERHAVWQGKMNAITTAREAGFTWAEVEPMFNAALYDYCDWTGQPRPPKRDSK